MRLQKWLSPCVLVGLLILSSSAQAQIVNVLSKVTKQSEDGFSGNLALSFTEKEGNTELLQYSGSSLAHYKSGDHVVSWIGTGSYLRKGAVDSDPIKKMFSHLRYRYFLKDWVSGEVFGQWEFDEARLLKSRMLLGVGPRMPFSITEEFSAAVGVALMLEREIEKNHDLDFAKSGEYVLRSSNYLELAFNHEDTVGFQVTMFYQPLVYANKTTRTPWKDHRILVEPSLSLKATSQLGIKLSYRYALNSAPFPDVEEKDTALMTSLTFSF